MTHAIKRYRVKTAKELLLEGWTEDGWYLKHPQAAFSVSRYGLGGEIEGRPTGYARVTDGLAFWHEDMLVELPDEQPGYSYIDEAPGAWETLSNAVGGIRPARCTHTNPDGSAAWVNQGFMHVLEACKFCGDKKP